MAHNGIGASVRRKEDLRFLTGRGNYVDDINRPGQLYAHIVRSPHPHAAIRRIDTAKAARAPGVAAVFTGCDIAPDKIGGPAGGWGVEDNDGSPTQEPTHLGLRPHPLLPIRALVAPSLAH